MSRIIVLGKNSSREFTEDQLINILESRPCITKPGKFQVNVSRVHTYQPVDESTGEMKTKRSLVNIQACTEYGKNQALKFAKAALKSPDPEKAAELWQEAMNTNIVSTVFHNEGGSTSTYLPVEGEEVFIMAKNHVNKQGETMLVFNKITPMPVEETMSLKGSFQSLLQEDDDDDTNELKKIAAEAKAAKKTVA